MKPVAYESIVTPELIYGAIFNDGHPGFREDYIILHCLMRRHQPKRIMEVGTNTGIGTRILCNAVPSACVMSIDLPREEADISAQHPSHSGQIVGQNCKTGYVQLWGDSLVYDFSVAWPIDAWFIDGEHVYNNVYSEARDAIASKAKLIVFHDADIPGVEKAIRDAFAIRLEDAVEDEYELYRVTGTRIAYAEKS